MNKPTHDNEPQAMQSEKETISGLLNNIKNNTGIAPYAYALMNPFDTESQLLRFAQSKQNGKGLHIYFGSAPGIGEEVQSDFIMKFFQIIFPQATYYPRHSKPANDIPASKTICITMKDVNEVWQHAEFQKQAIRTQEIDGTFSMVPAKILNSAWFDTYTTKNKLRSIVQERLSAQAGSQLNKYPLDSTPLLFLCSNVNHNFAEFSERIGGTFRMLDPYWAISLCIDGRAKPEWIIHTGDRVIRYFYALGDFVYIGATKNKLEGVNANAVVIVEDDSYLDHTKNPNAILDHSLKKRWRIYSFEEVRAAGWLQEIPKPKPITDADKVMLYREYQADPLKLPFDIEIKDIIRTICNKL